MRKSLGLVMALGLLLAAPAMSENTRADFGVRLFGVPVGQMILAKNADGTAYAAKGEFRTTGLVGLLARVRFTMSAHGIGTMPELRPRGYVEDVDTGYRASAVQVRFAPSDSRIDPLTGLIAALIDRDAGTGCAFEGQTFDGKRAMRVRIRPAAGSPENSLTCTGKLTRLSGYTDAEMAEAVTFPFSIHFERTGEKLVAMRADIDTIHGKVALLRR
ncbi:DUF3108 domain-containing protein [Maritimibacter sp. HL-12]|uniref:DUF3108 domain-containing protein n=1 Tax=Maritimibacter sp. HL-12 TaxID=1162418 RepID=UPI000A0F2134|nr:DUF3108 domain-containing protein [Maritimibacter sp. HL-12]SMH45733.1 Protein of unknown function [Maritimibacter sp. HL-12]